MQQTATTRPVPYFRGPGEVAFGIQPVLTEGHTAEGAMRLGEWALYEDGSGVHQSTGPMSATAVGQSKPAGQASGSSVDRVTVRSAPTTPSRTCSGAVAAGTTSRSATQSVSLARPSNGRWTIRRSSPDARP